MDDATPPEQLAASWRDNAAAWTRAVRGGAIESRRVATDAAMLEAISARHPRKVLDLGCGEGWLVRALAGRGIDALGVDGAQPLIEAATQAGGSFVCLSYAEIVADLAGSEQASTWSPPTSPCWTRSRRRCSARCAASWRRRPGC